VRGRVIGVAAVAAEATAAGAASGAAAAAEGAEAVAGAAAAVPLALDPAGALAGTSCAALVPRVSERGVGRDAGPLSSSDRGTGGRRRSACGSIQSLPGRGQMPQAPEWKASRGKAWAGGGFPGQCSSDRMLCTPLAHPGRNHWRGWWRHHLCCLRSTRPWGGRKGVRGRARRQGSEGAGKREWKGACLRVMGAWMLGDPGLGKRHWWQGKPWHGE